MCSASTIALRTSSSAIGASAISPLRTPRERDWPRPTMFSTPSALNSPTTAHTFDVPISKPTIMEEESNMAFLVAQSFGRLGRRGRNRAGFEPADGNVIADREIERRDGLVHSLPAVVNLAVSNNIPVR